MHHKANGYICEKCFVLAKMYVSDNQYFVCPKCKRILYMSMLTQIEEQVLTELDRMIDWHRDNGKALEHVTLKQNQYKAYKKILNKKLDGDVYRKAGGIEMDAAQYRGVKIDVIQRRRSHRKKDTESFI
jgi:hypothetical protein